MAEDSGNNKQPFYGLFSGTTPAGNENDFCANFLSEKPPLVHKISLNVAKCCVTELLK